MIFTKDFIDFDGTVYAFSDIYNLPREKENAFIKAICMYARSWTFARMTQEEKENCIKSFLWAEEQGMITGTFDHRWKIMQAIYNAYLTALGYYDNAIDWRGK